MLDRIYATRPEVERQLKEWALAQGFVVRLTEHNFRHPDGHNISNRIMKYPIRTQTPTVPYLDTMKWYDPDKGLLSNKKIKNSNPFLLRSTGGSYGRRPLMRWSSWESRWINDENAVYSDPLEDYLYGQAAIQVVDLSERGIDNHGEMLSFTYIPRNSNYHLGQTVGVFITTGMNKYSWQIAYDPRGFLENDEDMIRIPPTHHLHISHRDKLIIAGHAMEKVYCHKDHVVTIYDEDFETDVPIPRTFVAVHVDGTAFAREEIYRHGGREVVYIEDNGEMNFRYFFPSRGEKVKTTEVPVLASDGIVDRHEILLNEDQVTKIIKHYHYGNRLHDEHLELLESLGLIGPNSEGVTEYETARSS